MLSPEQTPIEVEMQPLKWGVHRHPSSINYLMVGDVASGKTCITKRLTGSSAGQFNTEHEYTLGANFDTKKITMPLPFTSHYPLLAPCSSGWVRRAARNR